MFRKQFLARDQLRTFKIQRSLLQTKDKAVTEKEFEH